MTNNKIKVRISIEYEFSEDVLHIEADEVLQVTDIILQKKYEERALRRAKTKFIKDLFKLAATAKDSFIYEVIKTNNYE